MELFDYLEVFHNHGGGTPLGQTSPAAFERHAMTRAAIRFVAQLR